MFKLMFIKRKKEITSLKTGDVVILKPTKQFCKFISFRDGVVKVMQEHTYRVIKVNIIFFKENYRFLPKYKVVNMSDDFFIENYRFLPK